MCVYKYFAYDIIYENTPSHENDVFESKLKQDGSNLVQGEMENSAPEKANRKSRRNKELLAKRFIYS